MARFRNAPPCDELGPGDGQDPRFDKKERKPVINRKALQLCAQVQDALNLAIADCADVYVRGAIIQSIVPAPDSSHMLVRVRTAFDGRLVQEQLEKAYPRLRAAVATSIHRKKVPQFRFEVTEIEPGDPEVGPG